MTDGIYTPLGDQEIRVALLLPGSPTDKIHCVLRTLNLDQGQPKYEALSWYWGIPCPETDPTIILEGREFSIPANLEAALEALRTPIDRPRVIWCDALCIDQQNPKEKAEQVRLMRKIYSGAWILSIWLGEATDDSALAFRSIRELSIKVSSLKVQDDQPDQLALKLMTAMHLHDPRAPFDPASWNAVWKLLSRPWFRRLWVIQELCLAPNERNIRVMCGSEIISWADFAMFYLVQHVLSSASDQVLLVDPQYMTNNWDQIFHVREMWREPAEANRCSLSSLMWQFRSQECTLLHDKVYALLSICHEVETGETSFQVNYNLPIWQVYTQATTFAIRSAKSLDILGACQLQGRVVENLPSWVPDWLTAQSARPIEPLVCWPPRKTAKFTVSSNMAASYRYDECGCSLQVTGFILGKVLFVGEKLQYERDTNVPLAWVREIQSWYDNARSHIGQSSDGKEDTQFARAFVRTVVTNRDGGCRKASDPDGSFVFKDRVLSLRDSSKFTWEFEHALDEENDAWSGPTISIHRKTALAFALAIANGVNRRVFFMTSNGHMGMGPKDMQEGDEIAVLLGAQVPFVVSRLNNGNFRLNSECYVDGIMEGELMPDVESGRRKVVEITLE